MKPHHLRIEAFGPYAEPTAIDFDRLSEEGLFLIHGSTGAGKTFLLDALCFALYGEVSGDRQLKGLKSDHAAAAAVPRVSLEFSCHGCRYRVERSPSYTAPKARGQGFTERPPQAALLRVIGDEVTPIASRTTEVNREVEALVGLNAAQFRQVILLPQGRFAEVLRARAEEREALLKTLFHTVAYERAGLWLEEQAKAARQRQQECDREQQVLRRQALQLWRSLAAPIADAARIEAAATTAAPPAAHPAAAPPLTLGNGAAPEPQAGAPQTSEAEGGEPEAIEDQAGLEQLRQRLEALVALTEQRLLQRSAELQTALAAQAEQQRLADRWQRRAAARERLQALDAKQPVVADYSLRLQQAERAEALRASVEAEAAARSERDRLQERIRQQLHQAAQARHLAQALPEAVRQLDLDSPPAPADLAAARTGLAVRRVELSALARQAEQATQAQLAADQAGRLAAAAQLHLDRGQAERTRRQQQREGTAAALQQATSARDQLDGLQRAAREALARAQACEAIAAATQRQQQCLAARDQADAEQHRCQATVQQLRQSQRAGMAASLALQLSSGSPCPVCGASEHPAPAAAAADAVSEQALAAAEQQLQQATARARQAATALATADSEAKALRHQAGGEALDPGAARQAAQQAEQALAAAGTRAAALASHQQEIQAQDQALLQLQTSLQADGTELTLQQRTAQEATQQAQALRAAIAAELGEGLDPSAVLQGYPPLEAALQDLAAGCEAAAATATRLQQASARLLQELAATEFSDAAAVQAALKDAAWRRKLADRIEAYNRERIEVQAVLADPDLAGLPPEQPDTAAGQRAVQAADQARTAAVEGHSQARSAHREMQRLAAEHQQGAAALEAARQRTQLISGVADRCTGRAAPFISLQRWVLSAYLAEICGYANQRLEQMTSGRYQLRLSDEGGRGGRQAGLGLRVLDGWTAEEREVSSLSGGETFQASLALALGVADTVQAHAGGVHLEALFIDEGFGTLDPDNLQLAMDELDRLREGGRLIGIISHVGALRERIRTGIAVSAGETGSTARVCRTAAD